MNWFSISKTSGTKEATMIYVGKYVLPVPVVKKEYKKLFFPQILGGQMPTVLKLNYGCRWPLKLENDGHITHHFGVA